MALRITTRAPVAGLLQHLDRVIGGVTEVHRGEIKFKLTGLDFREIKQIIDEGQEKPAAGMDVVDIATILVILDFAKALKPHDFRETHDGIKRRAQFMADAGEEFGLLPACGFRHFLGVTQFRFSPLPLGNVTHHGAEGGARDLGLQRVQ